MKDNRNFAVKMPKGERRLNLTANPPRGKRQRPTAQIDWNRAVGRQVLDRALPNIEFDKLLRLTLRRAGGGDGFHKATNGVGKAILDVLRDPTAREEFLLLARVSPEAFGSDEECARSLAIGLMIADLARMVDAIALKRLALFESERDMALFMRSLGKPFNDEAERSDWKAQLNGLTADLIHTSARHLGRALERDFGLRASRPIAEFVTRIFELTPRMTERRARRLCGWNKAKPPELLRQHNLSASSCRHTT